MLWENGSWSPPEIKSKSQGTEPIAGKRLKDTVSEHLYNRLLSYTNESSSYVPLAEGLAENFSLLAYGTDANFWETPRGNDEIRNTLASFCTSFHYAHTKTGRESSFVPLYAEPISDKQKWKNIIRTTLADDVMRGVFQENAWRPPMTTFPDRGVPLQYILSHEFGSSPITSVDLGTGLNMLFPLLNSPRYLQYEFEGRNYVQRFARNVNVALSIGVDNQHSDEDWAKASIWPIEGGLKRLQNFDALMDEVRVLRDDGNERFPFVKQDIVVPGGLSVIQNVLMQRTGTTEVDVVNSSFVRQYLEDTPETQHRYSSLIATLLKEGGILIESGTENTQSNKPQGTAVIVYRKINGMLKKIGTPFTLANQITVDSVDPTYFKAR